MNLIEEQMFERVFTNMQRAVYANSYAKGFHTGSVDDESISQKLALIHSEVSEALEELRRTNVSNEDRAENFVKELADVIIRTMDLAEAMGLNLGAAITQKHLVNLKREPKHGKRF